MKEACCTDLRSALAASLILILPPGRDAGREGWREECWCGIARWWGCRRWPMDPASMSRFAPADTRARRLTGCLGTTVREGRGGRAEADAQDVPNGRVSKGRQDDSLRATCLLAADAISEAALVSQSRRVQGWLRFKSQSLFVWEHGALGRAPGTGGIGEREGSWSA